MSALGQLVVKLALNHAEYTQGLDKSSQEALKFAQNSQKSFDQAERSAREYFGNVASGAVGVVTSIVGMEAAISRTRNAINFLANLDDAAQRTQSRVEDISRIAKTAKNFGDPFDQIEQSISKLGKGLATFDDEGNQALRALDAIKVKSRDSNGELRASAEVYIDVAKALRNYEDGLGKTAVVNALFGKSGAEQLPLLNNLAQGIDDVSSESADATKRADDFNNSVAKGNGIIDALYTKMAIDLLPTLTDISSAVNDSAGEMDELSSVSVVAGGALKTLAIVGRGVFDAFRDVGREIGGRAAQLVAIANGDFKGAGLIGDEITKDFIKSQAEYEKFVDTILSGQQKIEAATGAVDGKSKIDFTLNNPDEDEAKKKAQKAVKDAAEAAKQQVERYKDLTVAIGLKIQTNAIELKSNHALTESERIRLDITGKIEKGELVMNSVRKAKIESQLDELEVSEKLLANNRFVREQSDALFKSGNSMLMSLRSQVDQQKAQNELVGLSKEQVMALAGAKDMETAAIVRNAAVYAGDMHDAYIQYANDLDEAVSLQKELLQEQQIQQYAQNWNQLWGGVEQTAKTAFVQFAAHGKSAVESIGESIKTAIIDVLYQLTVRKWVINIGAAIGMGGSGAATAGGLGLDDLASAGSNALGLFKSGFGATGLLSKAGSMLPGSVGSFFGGMGVTGTQAAAQSGASALWGASGATGAASMGASVAAFAGPAIAIAAVDQITRMLVGDKTLGGTAGKVLNFVPILGPLINGLFGRGPMKQGMTVLKGDVGADGFESGMLQTRFDAKGGAFRSNKTDFATVDAVTGAVSTDNKKLKEYADDLSGTADEIIGLINDTTKQVSSGLYEIGEDLGISTKGLDDFSHTIKLVSKAGKGLTEEQIGNEIAAITDEMAHSLLPTIGEFSRRGESATQALSRLSQEFDSLENAAMNLGASSEYATNLVQGMSISSRTALIELAGGVESLSNKTSFFAQNFLTEQERLDPIIDALRTGLESLGLAADITKDQFKTLVQDVNLSNEMRNSLLDLAPALIAVTDAQDKLIEQSRQTAEQPSIEQPSAADNLAAAFSALQRSVDVERNRVTEEYNAAVKESEARINGVTNSIGKLKSLSDALKSTIDNILPLDRNQAKRQIQDAINAARSGGGLPDASSLSNALGVLGNSGSITGARSSFEFAREQAKTANLVAELGGLTDSQLTLEERSLDALEAQRGSLDAGFKKQINSLDSLLEQGQTQIDVLRGINVSILSLADALLGFNAASSAAGGASIGVTKSGVSYGDIRGFAAAHTPDENYAAAMKYGISESDIAASGAYTSSEIDSYMRAKGLPRFANGGFHRGGLRIVGERGPELEATGPSRITSNSELVELLGNKDLIVQVKDLIVEMKQSTKFSERVANKLDSVTVGGTSIRVHGL